MLNKNESKRKIALKVTGDIIKKNRIKHNISQEILANSLGVTKSSISRYESGSMEIPVSLLPIICKECGFSPIEYATAWMNMNIDNIPNENKEAYINTIKMIEFIVNESLILVNYDKNNEEKSKALDRISEIYNEYIKIRGSK